MLPTEDLFAYVYVLIDDLIADRPSPPRAPGPGRPAVPARADDVRRAAGGQR